MIELENIKNIQMETLKIEYKNKVKKWVSLTEDEHN